MRINEGKIIFFVIFIGLIIFVSLRIYSQTKYPYSDSERDPLLPLVTKTGQILLRKPAGTKGLVLKGIVYADGASEAIIGEEIFKENDKVGEYQIKKIGKNKVILKKDKELLILKLEEK
jgi:hypothetical protein